MRKTFALAAIAALAAAPLAAQSVPLNTVVGGQGEERLEGQGLVGGALGTTAATIGIVTAIVVVAAASSDGVATTTAEE